MARAAGARLVDLPVFSSHARSGAAERADAQWRAAAPPRREDGCADQANITAGRGGWGGGASWLAAHGLPVLWGHWAAIRPAAALMGGEPEDDVPMSGP